MSVEIIRLLFSPMKVEVRSNIATFLNMVIVVIVRLLVYLKSRSKTFISGPYFICNLTEYHLVMYHKTNRNQKAHIATILLICQRT